jgi:glycosyl hydrolase, family 88
MIGCSYLNGYRLGGHKEYKDVIVETARSLCTRFRPNAGVIQSWNVDRGWQSQRGWTCPVIIDNMMNLELLFEATRMSGDSTFWNIAVQHANTTMANHFRTDYSCYHVIDYDPATGKVLNKHTAQGYAHETSWARGQAWAIYGFTVCYRYTRDKRYLDLAQKVLNFILKNKNMPKDLVPYWDYDAPNIPNEPRDASSAACVASALYEMDVYLPGNNYRGLANRMLRSLSTPAYRAPLGKNGCFLLMHSVGSIPHNNEIDVPLNYADYYFLEALMRQRKAPKF